MYIQLYFWKGIIKDDENKYGMKKNRKKINLKKILRKQ